MTKDQIRTKALHHLDRIARDIKELEMLSEMEQEANHNSVLPKAMVFGILKAHTIIEEWVFDRKYEKLTRNQFVYFRDKIKNQTV